MKSPEACDCKLSGDLAILTTIAAFIGCLPDTDGQKEMRDWELTRERKENSKEPAKIDYQISAGLYFCISYNLQITKGSWYLHRIAYCRVFTFMVHCMRNDEIVYAQKGDMFLLGLKTIEGFSVMVDNIGGAMVNENSRNY